MSLPLSLSLSFSPLSLSIAEMNAACVCTRWIGRSILDYANARSMARWNLRSLASPFKFARKHLPGPSFFVACCFSCRFELYVARNDRTHYLRARCLLEISSEIRHQFESSDANLRKDNHVDNMKNPRPNFEFRKDLFRRIR